MELGYEVVAKPQRYLYCTAEDPLQLHSLNLELPEYSQLAAELEGKVMDWMLQQKDGFAQQWKNEAKPF